jgi:hypothetical protein
VSGGHFRTVGALKRERRTLGAEGFAAGAAGGGVWVFDFEAAVGEGVDVVEFGAGDVEGAFGIDDDADAGAFDEDVAVGRGVLEIHFVLKAAAAAADDGDAKDAVGAILTLEEGADFAGGVGGDFHKALVADSEVRTRGRSGLCFGHHCACSVRAEEGGVNFGCVCLRASISVTTPACAAK